MIRRPREGIIILGTPRSGTTLLRRLLDAHPVIACPGETSLFSGCARLLESERIAEDVEIGVLPGLAFAGFRESEVLARLREFAFAFHREHAARHGKKRWAEKTAFDSFHVEAIARLCGQEVDFICLQRHGLDVAVSLQDLCEKNGGYLKELHRYVGRYPRPLEAFAHVWVDLTRAIRGFANAHPENAVLVRYEDLVENPEGEMRRVLGFLGETWDPSILALGLSRRDNLGFGDWKTYGKEDFDRKSIGRWRSLSKRTVRNLAEICNPTLQACGYDRVDPGGGDTTSGDDRRRYEIGLLVQAMEIGSPRARGGKRARGRRNPPGGKSDA